MSTVRTRIKCECDFGIDLEAVLVVEFAYEPAHPAKRGYFVIPTEPDVPESVEITRAYVESVGGAHLKTLTDYTDVESAVWEHIQQERDAAAEYTADERREREFA